LLDPQQPGSSVSWSIAAVQIGLHRVIPGQHEKVALANQLVRLCSGRFNGAQHILDGEQAILKPMNYVLPFDPATFDGHIALMWSSERWLMLSMLSPAHSIALMCSECSLWLPEGMDAANIVVLRLAHLLGDGDTTSQFPKPR
jgi:hypothetical protein